MSLVNKRTLSEIIGKSERTITTWQKNGLPIAFDGVKGQQNRYETADVIEWLIDRAVGHGQESDSFDLDSERARLAHHQANKTALEEKVLAGKLIPQQTVEDVWGSMISSFRSRVLSIPTKAAHEFVGLHELNIAQELMKKHLYEALTELSDYSPEQYGISEDPEEHTQSGSPTTESDGKPVGGCGEKTIQ